MYGSHFAAMLQIFMVLETIWNQTSSINPSAQLLNRPFHVYCTNKIGHITKDCDIIVNLFKKIIKHNTDRITKSLLVIAIEWVSSFYSNMN